MKNGPKEPAIPPDAHDTIRRKIADALKRAPCSARDLSIDLGIPEREVYGHLEHIRKTVHTGGQLLIMPAVCRKCGFVFAKRERFKKPGKCPLCKNESIQEPRFSIG